MKSLATPAFLVLVAYSLVGSASAQFPRVRISPNPGSNDWINFGQQVSVAGTHLAAAALGRFAFYERSPLFASPTWNLALDEHNVTYTDDIVLAGDRAFWRSHTYDLTGWQYPFVQVLTWDGANWNFQQLIAFTASQCSASGTITATADRFAVSTPCEGRVSIFSRQGESWTPEGTALQGNSTDLFGAVVSFGPDYLAVGAPSANSNAGLVFLYTLSGTNWALAGTLVGSSSDPGDRFGARLSASGDLLVVGAPNDQPGGLGSPGTAYVFSRSAGVWGEEAQIRTSVAGLQLGDVAVHGDVVYVGRTGTSAPISQCGADVYRRVGGPWPFFTWEYQYKLWTPDALQTIGASIATDGVTVVLGQPGTTPQNSAVFAFSAPEAPQAYCTAKPNSVGCTPSIGTSGSPCLSGPDDFHVLATSIINHSPGIMFWGPAWNSVPFSGGTLCVLPPLIRTPAQFAGGNGVPPIDCSGSFDFHFSAAYMQAYGLVPGSLVCAQYYSRDNGYAPPNNIGLTDAVFFVVRP